MTALLEAHGVTKVFGGGIFDKRKTIALENFSPRPELPRGLAPTMTYPCAASTCQSKFAKSS